MVWCVNLNRKSQLYWQLGIILTVVQHKWNSSQSYTIHHSLGNDWMKCLYVFVARHSPQFMFGVQFNSVAITSHYGTTNTSNYTTAYVVVILELSVWNTASRQVLTNACVTVCDRHTGGNMNGERWIDRQKFIKSRMFRIQCDDEWAKSDPGSESFITHHSNIRQNTSGKRELNWNGMKWFNRVQWFKILKHLLLFYDIYVAILLRSCWSSQFSQSSTGA